MNDKRPAVTIVVPVYNGEDYLTAALDSVLEQDYPNLEIIAVDDGSTDSTPDILARYSSRITVMRQGNAGQSNALKNGWAAARGEIIGYLSADDRLGATAVSRCVEALVADPEAVLAYPNFNVIDENSNYSTLVQPANYRRELLYADLTCLPGPGALFRKNAYLEVGPWRSDLKQVPDLEFFLRLGLSGDFVHVAETLADFRRHSGSTTYRKVPFERGEEPTLMLDSFFERSDLPAEITGWRGRVYANGLLLSSMIHGGSGRRSVALTRLIQAFGKAPGATFSLKGLAAIRLILRGAH